MLKEEKYLCPLRKFRIARILAYFTSMHQGEPKEMDS